MLFEIKSAPEMCQRKMRGHVEGLKGVEVIADDFAIVDYGKHPMSSKLTIPEMFLPSLAS